VKLPYSIIGIEGYSTMSPLSWGTAGCHRAETGRIYNLTTGRSCSGEEWSKIVQNGAAGAAPSMAVELDEEDELDKPIVLAMQPDLPSITFTLPREKDGYIAHVQGDGTGRRRHYFVFRNIDDFGRYIDGIGGRLQVWLQDANPELHDLEMVCNDLMTLNSTDTVLLGFYLAVQRRRHFLLSAGSLRGDDTEKKLWASMTAWDKYLLEWKEPE